MNMQMINTAIEFTQSALALAARSAENVHSLNRVDTTDEALIPATGKAIYAMYQSNNFFVLKTEQASQPLLGITANNNYRFLHDLDHALNYRSGRGTISLKDELYLNCLMSQRVFNLLNTTYFKCDRRSAIYAAVIVFCDLVEQVRYYEQFKSYIYPQAPFILDCLNQYQYIFDMVDSGNTLDAQRALMGLWRECGVGQGV